MFNNSEYYLVSNSERCVLTVNDILRQWITSAVSESLHGIEYPVAVCKVSIQWMMFVTKWPLVL